MSDFVIKFPDIPLKQMVKKQEMAHDWNTGKVDPLKSPGTEI